MKIDWSELVEATLGFIEVDPGKQVAHIGLGCPLSGPQTIPPLIEMICPVM